MKFCSTFNTSVQRCLYPLFQNQCPHFLLLYIFWRMAVHPSPSEFTSRTHPLIFLWTPKGLISPEYFLIFFSNLCIPPIFQPWKKCFKLMVLRLLENTFVSKRLESVHFYSYPQVFIITTLGRKKLPISPKQSILKIYFLPSERERTMELKISPKLNLQGYWSQVLIYSTIFNLNIFDFCFVVPQFRLSMLKCEGSLA